MDGHSVQIIAASGLEDGRYELRPNPRGYAADHSGCRIDLFDDPVGCLQNGNVMLGFFNLSPRFLIISQAHAAVKLIPDFPMFHAPVVAAHNLPHVIAPGRKLLFRLRRSAAVERIAEVQLQ